MSTVRRRLAWRLVLQPDAVLARQSGRFRALPRLGSVPGGGANLWHAMRLATGYRASHERIKVSGACRDNPVKQRLRIQDQESEAFYSVPSCM